MSGVRFAGSAFGNLSTSLLTTSGLKGEPGQSASTPQDGSDGKDNARQKIIVGNQGFISDDLTEFVFPGATATLENNILTLECLRGGDGLNGNDSASAPIVVAGETYMSDSLTSLVFPGATASLNAHGRLSLESLKGGEGLKGSSAAMQSMVVARETYLSDALTSLVSPGPTATLDNGVLTLTSLQGPPGQATDGTHGTDGLDAAPQHVNIKDDIYTKANIDTLEFIGAAGVLNGTTLEVSGLQGGKGDKVDASTEKVPPGDNATATVLASDASGANHETRTPPS
ncbi:hypothetical protein N9L68_01890 [bacterium]|nr:hypothetical protein [bacterium]